MAYATSNALNVQDLLARFRTFAQDQGWIVEFYGAKTDGDGDILTLRNGASWFTLMASPTVGSSSNAGPYFGLLLHTGQGSQPSSGGGKPGASNAVWANRITSPVQTYHFFSGNGPNGPYLYIVVETDPGTFRHIGIGTLKKMGDYPGGDFGFASSWSLHEFYLNDPNSSQHMVPFDDRSALYDTFVGGTILRADYGGIAPRYHYVEAKTEAVRGRGGWRHDGEEYSTIRLPVLCGASQQTGRAPLFPMWCAVNRGSGLWSDIGYPPDMRSVRMDNLEPGQQYTLGGDTWLVFPVCRKNGGAGLPNSGGYGYAYRRT